MSDRMRWDLAKERVRVDQLNEGKAYETQLAYITGADQHTAEDIILLEEALATKHLWPAVRKWCSDQLEWLKGAPRRHLSKAGRYRLRKTVRLCRRIARGEIEGREQPPDYTLRYTKRWGRTQRPEWMDDPTLLPKRPPGKS